MQGIHTLLANMRLTEFSLCFETRFKGMHIQVQGCELLLCGLAHSGSQLQILRKEREVIEQTDVGISFSDYILHTYTVFYQYFYSHQYFGYTCTVVTPMTTNGI